MADTVAVLTPVTETKAVELGRTLYRKQVLAHGEYKYNDRTLKFTPEYTGKVVQAFKDQAYDTVPFMLADRDNAHTMDPLRAKGTVQGLEATPDGIDALISLTDDAAQIVKDNPAFGVSVRLLENLERADGKSYPVALNHVLGTFDPRLTNLRPWQQVELSNDDAVHVLDLTALTAPSTGDPDQKGAAVPTLADTFSDEEITRLKALLTDSPAKEPSAPASADTYQRPTDAELDAIAKGLMGDDTDTTTETAPAATDTPAPAAAAASTGNETEVAASNTDTGTAVELANTQARADRLEIELSRLRSESDERDYTAFRERMARDSGIPPYICDLARPLLQGRHTVDLSNGTEVDAGDIVRQVLSAVGDHGKIMDFSTSDVVFDRSAADQDEAKLAEINNWAAEHAKTIGG